MDHDWNHMMDLRREAAKKKNAGRWTISDTPGNYKDGKDKDGLSADRRAIVEAAKDRLTYQPEEQDLW